MPPSIESKASRLPYPSGAKVPSTEGLSKLRVPVIGSVVVVVVVVVVGVVVSSSPVVTTLLASSSSSSLNQPETAAAAPMPPNIAVTVFCQSFLLFFPAVLAEVAAAVASAAPLPVPVPPAVAVPLSPPVSTFPAASTASNIFSCTTCRPFPTVLLRISTNTVTGSPVAFSSAAIPPSIAAYTQPPWS